MSGGGELRQNVVTGRWVVVAPGRGERPMEHEGGRVGSSTPHDPDCPFCPGNEAELPRILEERPGGPGEPWGLRVVPNRYGAFAEKPRNGEGDAALPGPVRLRSGPPVRGRASRAARGRQEVIVESPVHNREPSDMSATELERLVTAWRDRYREAATVPPGRCVVLFRNQGRPAGASLVHPHTQLVALDAVPARLALLDDRTADWHARHGSCLLCDLPGLEADLDARTVWGDDAMVAFVPWAPETSMEVWVMPRTHRRQLSDATGPELASLARALGHVLGALHDHGGDPAYNLMVHSSPAEEGTAAHRHWFLRVRPRAAQPAGFELATDVHMVPSLPEGDAATLRGEASP